MITGIMFITPSLIDRLRECAQLWAAANEASLARLGRTVVNDGGFFSRIDQPSASTTTATLERFARFLSDEGNWPGGQVPPDVVAFAHVNGVTAPAAAASPGNPDRISQNSNN